MDGTLPGIWLKRRPWAEATPEASVTKVKVFEPLPNAPVAPSVGRVKTTAAPGDRLFVFVDHTDHRFLRGLLLNAACCPFALDCDDLEGRGERLRVEGQLEHEEESKPPGQQVRSNFHERIHFVECRTAVEQFVRRGQIRGRKPQIWDGKLLNIENQSQGFAVAE